MPNGLTARHLQIIRDTLAPYSDKIDCVRLFGSRATGRFRENSDIDIVLYGSLTQADIDRIWTLFDASMLPVTVDIHAYERITNMVLKKHIDDVSQTIFEKQDFRTPV